MNFLIHEFLIEQIIYFIEVKDNEIINQTIRGERKKKILVEKKRSREKLRKCERTE